MILLIDNYDSFTFNLRRYLARLGQEVRVLRNDSPELRRDLVGSYSALLISPGPNRPSEAGHCLEIVQNYSGRLPILGVCLGHQVIFQAFGGTVDRARRPMHGKATQITLLPSRLFAGLGSSAVFARYHSLVGTTDSLPSWLRVVAWSREGEIMAVEHREHLTFGVQFHPESVLSTGGYQVLQNFLISAGLHRVAELPALDYASAPFQFDPVLQSDPAESGPTQSVPVQSDSVQRASHATPPEEVDSDFPPVPLFGRSGVGRAGPENPAGSKRPFSSPGSSA